ncbi:MAG: nucleotide sugar dehydrogenase [Geminicoccaceae bacterium]|nr:MAG: nucleotide sugar dehydrogenase [Geminicoccaceae bacterium]
MPGRRLAVIGLGYVGLPVAVAFARLDHVIGFDIDARRVAELAQGFDRTGEVEPEALAQANLQLTTDAAALVEADFYIITVPTPVDDARLPDLGPVLAATRTVAAVLKPGDIVVYESTVYPGATEEDCVPVLEAASNLSLGVDFAVGYSPERINPGDREHRLQTITKVVAASDPAALEVVAQVYGRVVEAGIHRAPSIKTAEAAKVIENTQRDLNIALINELALIFHRLGLDTRDVLDAAGTKWNFLRFQPGLVGGHCIGVDPYYLTHRAQRTGYHPEVILAGRRINDAMAGFVATTVVERLLRDGRRDLVVTVLGATFKPNVPDVRNSQVAHLVRALQRFGCNVHLCEPLLETAEIAATFAAPAFPLDGLPAADAVVLAVPHAPFVEGGWPLIAALLREGQGHVADIAAVLDREAVPAGIDLWRL